MEEFWSWISQHWEIIPSTIAALVSSIALALRGRSIRRALKKAKDRETYIKCSKCGCIHKLSDLDFFLPSGHKDNDLDGIPDIYQEGEKM